MELTAAIEGIQFCPKDAKLVIYTDSNYVKQGITEWIHGWKKKTGKTLKSGSMAKLDATCQGRDIEWHWVKAMPDILAMKWPINWPIRAQMKP